MADRGPINAPPRRRRPSAGPDPRGKGRAADKDAAPGAEVRAVAARIVDAVRSKGRSLTDAALAEQGLDPRDRPLLRELCAGTLRRLPRLEALIALLVRRPMKAADKDLEALLLVGLYQLDALRMPSHAVVGASVEATRVLGKPWAAGLVNGVLRRRLREAEALSARLDADPVARWLLPRWLLDRLQAAWPEHWQHIASALMGRAPMQLRVNRGRSDRDSYRQQLAAAGIDARALDWNSLGLVLDAAVPTAQLPGFEAGLVSVQDAGAQLAADLLDAAAGDAVLDCCAAPGGKSAHLLERAGAGMRLTAVDHDRARLDVLRANLDRLGLEAEVAVGDAAAPAGSWAERRYQRILLDAPCSATGVIRRHPDIKCLRRDTDVAQLAAVQRRMLAAVWPLLADGGRLLYATCSLLPEENEHQIAAFLAAHADARELPIDAAWGLQRSHGRQLLPADAGPDGFYYALLCKAPAAGG